MCCSFIIVSWENTSWAGHFDILSKVFHQLLAVRVSHTFNEVNNLLKRLFLSLSLHIGSCLSKQA